MSWPLSQDYNEAIQSPAANFTDPDLKRGEAVANALGLPAPYSGNFADVYQMRCPDGSRWAVKCFTREALGLHERYQEISGHLKQAKLPFTVDFSYLEKGIRIGGKWYPILKMQWVEGLTLNQFIGQYLEKPAMLEALLQLWARMGKLLRASDIAHCDLQHGNVLLVPGSTPNALALKLIDYDGMWVPALAGKKSGEVGHPSYQHPQRLREGTYSLDVDRFPMLLVATAMRALKADKGLWAKYDNGDNLLFKEPDLREPGQSEVFQELASLPDAGLVMLAAHVRAALRGGLDSAPLLEDAMPDVRPAPAPAKAPRPAAAAAPASGVQPAVSAAAPVTEQVQGFKDYRAPALSSAVRKPKKKGRRKAESGGIRLPMAAWIGVVVGMVVMAMLVGGLAVWALTKRPDAPIAPGPDNHLVQKDAGGAPRPDQPAPTPKDGSIVNPPPNFNPPPFVNPPPNFNPPPFVPPASGEANQQVMAVVADLKARNPGFDGKVKPTIENGVVVGLEFLTDDVTDLSPVRALVGLRTLNCHGSPFKGGLADLSPLKGMSLTSLDCTWTKVTDLSPLTGMPLTSLTFIGTQVSTLAPLTGMPLTTLNCQSTKVVDLAPLKGMPLKTLFLTQTPVADLSPLTGMQLASLDCPGTLVSDLSPLKGMLLTHLICDNTGVSDLSPLKGMPLTFLGCYNTLVSDLSPLKDTKLTFLMCGQTRVSDLSPLKSLPLKTLLIPQTAVSDLSALRGMRLTSLECSGSSVSDLSPLAGMPLTNLRFGATKVSDLSPVKGMKVYDLDCSGTLVSDLSPLKGTPLKYLHCDFKPDDAEVLRSISTLESINNKPAKGVLNAVSPR